MESKTTIYIKVGIIIENSDGEILLIKERTEKDSALAWNIIKGSYEVTDGKIEECAKRECQEEVGLDVEILGISNIMFFHKKDTLKIQYNFVARPLSGKPTVPKDRNVSIENEDIQICQWFKPEEIVELSKDDFVADYTSLVIKNWLDNKTIYPLSILQYQ